MPQGKPAGVRCVQLTEDYRCKIFDDPGRPQICHALMPTEEMCGENREQAMRWWGMLEQATQHIPVIVHTQDSLQNKP